jgi:hypothetical protein
MGVARCEPLGEEVELLRWVDGGVGRRREGNGVRVGGLEVALLQGVGQLLEQPTPIVGDNGHLAVPLIRVVASVEEAAPIVSDYIRFDGSRVGQNGDAPRGLPHDVLLSPPHVELVEELADFVENELGRRRDLGRGIHGDRNRESTTLVPIVSNLISELVERGREVEDQQWKLGF